MASALPPSKESVAKEVSRQRTRWSPPARTNSAYSQGTASTVSVSSDDYETDFSSVTPPVPTTVGGPQFVDQPPRRTRARGSRGRGRGKPNVVEAEHSPLEKTARNRGQQRAAAYKAKTAASIYPAHPAPSYFAPQRSHYVPQQSTFSSPTQLTTRGYEFNPSMLQAHNMTLEETARYLALDCEMVGVLSPVTNTVESALARVTLVNWFGVVVYDQYCLPSQPIVDYRTFVSGITPEHLKTRGLPLAVIRSQVSQLLKNQILVGHGLDNDLAALQLTHPWTHIRDTSKYEPFQKIRCFVGGEETVSCDSSLSSASGHSSNGHAAAGGPVSGGGQFLMGPRRLKDLAAEYLQKEIQVEGRAHCPVEDAWTALELYRKIRPSWETCVAAQISAHLDQRQQQLARARAQACVAAATLGVTVQS
jgi:RNA exonuclease 4